MMDGVWVGFARVQLILAKCMNHSFGPHGQKQGLTRRGLPANIQGVGLGLMVILMFTFSTTNALGFYVSFEASLIPTLMLIIG